MPESKIEPPEGMCFRVRSSSNSYARTFFAVELGVEYEFHHPEKRESIGLFLKRITSAYSEKVFHVDDATYIEEEFLTEESVAKAMQTLLDRREARLHTAELLGDYPPKSLDR